MSRYLIINDYEQYYYLFHTSNQQRPPAVSDAIATSKSSDCLYRGKYPRNNRFNETIIQPRMTGCRGGFWGELAGFLSRR